MPESATPPQFVVAQLGARRHYAIPRMLNDAGMLSRFHTDICATKGWPRLLKAVPPPLRPAGLRSLMGRIPSGVPSDLIETHGRFGLDYARRLVRARGQNEIAEVYLWAGHAFASQVAAQRFAGASGVYTFNNGGLEILRTAGAEGLQTVMEQTIAPRRIQADILEAERERHPDWAEASVVSAADDALIAREEEEWQAATTILCGSSFVRDSIARAGGPAERCVVVPYGIDSGYAMPCDGTANESRPHDGPLRVLSVGTVGLRKGAPYVAEAAERLAGRAVFRMVGAVSVPPAAQRRLSAALELTGPVPRSEVARHFAWADVFLLPSLCEGSAGVTYEALSAGLPVICTHNTGSAVRHGSDGYIVGLRDVDAIAGHLDRLASDADLLAGMSAAAAARRGDIDLDAYRQRLLAALSGAPGTERLTA